MEELDTYNIPYDKKKIEAYLLLALLILLFLISWYALKMQNDYNALAVQYNNLSRHCIPTGVPIWT